MKKTVLEIFEKFLSRILLITLYIPCHSQEYNFRNYTTENGLSQAQVLCIMQDSSGIVWMGTNDGGITKYDGNTFEYINTKNGLADNVVFSALQVDDGIVMVGTNNGISLIEKNKIENFKVENGLSSNRIFDIEKSKSKSVLLGTGSGVTEFKAGVFTKKYFGSSLDSAAVFDVFVDGMGSQWYSTLGYGVYRVIDEKIQHINSLVNLPELYIYSVFQKDENEFWLSTHSGLYSITVASDNYIIKPIFANEINFSTTQFYSVTQDIYGSIWISTSSGVFRYHNNSLERITTKNGLVNNSIWKVFVDKEKNIWLGSKESGVSVLSSLAWVLYNEKYGNSSKTVNSVGKWSNEILLGTQSGFSVIKNNAYKSYTNADGLASGEALCIERDKSGYYWIGTGSGITKFKDGKFVNYEFDKKTLNDYNRCYDIYIDEKNEIFLGTHGGLAVIQNNKLAPVSFASENPKIILDIHKDGEGVLWMGCLEGLYSLKGGVFRKYNENDGITSKRINNITEDKNKTLWVSTHEGVYYLKEDKFYKISTAEGLYSNNAYSIIFDKKNRLWIGQPNGVDRVELGDNYSVKSIKHFDADNGFMGKECTDNSVYVDDSTGHLYFGTVNGLMVYRPEYEKENSTAPITQIKKINLFSQPTDWNEHADSVNFDGLPVSLILPFSKNYLTFHFVGISMSAPSKVRYLYMLKGIDKDWLPVTNKTEAIYNNLPPGKYEFIVKSCNEDNIWSQAQSFKFKIAPPFYRTWWFYSLCAAIVLAGIFSYIKIRSANIKIIKQSRIIAEKNKHIQLAYVEIEQSHKNITDSIRYAKRLQDAILPAEKHIRSQFPDSFVIYKPKDIVSGDFYWMVNKGGKVLISAIDCTGHGVPGALVSIVGNNGLMRSVNEFGLVHPSEILDKLSALVEETLRQNDEAEVRDGMDMALCMFESDFTKMEFSGANNPLYLLRSRNDSPLIVNGIETKPVVSIDTHSLYEIKPDKQPIGVFEGRKKFTNNTVHLHKNDTIYLFSDGYADQFGGPKGKKFLYKSLREILLSVQGKEMAAQKEFIINAFENWRGNHEQVDDVCVIGLKV